MKDTEIIGLIKEAAQSHSRVVITFSKPVSICLHGKYQKPTKQITLRFFELFNDDGVYGYGYKQRINETRGYNIKSLPTEFIETMELEEKTDYAHQKKLFKSYILRTRDADIWPDLEENIDSILDNLFPNQYVRMYLKSYANDFEMMQIENLFKNRYSGRVDLSSGLNIFVETSKREKGYYAWLVIGNRSYMMLSPKVAVIASR